MTTARRRTAPSQTQNTPSKPAPKPPGPAPWTAPVPTGAGHHGPEPAPLRIGVQHDGRTTVLRLCGELDLATAGGLHRHITVVLNEHDPHRLLLELSELTFTDSSGLAVMVWAHQSLDRRGRQLRLYHPHPRVLRILHVTGLHTRLHITEGDPKVALSAGRRRLGRHRATGSPDGARAGSPVAADGPPPAQ
ncbi:STAS domain-containing protein [Actinomadura sp. NTSP31]|uniref:STAS domain-containing protein n=1 Tax=Actinomadura sp. NTSP31 TaxID=1735447 RepID=UPI0035C08544